MKRLVIILFGLFIIACSSDDNTETSDDNGEIIDKEDRTYFKYTLKEKNNPDNLVYSQEYSFDNEGKVISENYTFFYNQIHNYHSTFEYNENGQVTREIRDGQLYFYIIWDNNSAEVFNNQDQNIAVFNFDGERLTDYKTELNTGYVRTRKLNYDSNQNIVSVEDETEIFTEFLDYNLTKRNPLNRIHSIGILRIDYKPFFKNIFSIEKVYPFEGDDFSQPLRFYQYTYEFDSQNRVYQIENEKSAIYTQEFTYE